MKPFPPPDLAHVFYLGTLTSVAYGCLTVYLLFAKTKFVSFCSNRFFLYSATLGYGIYLVHIPVVRLLVVPLYHALNLTASPVVWFSGLTLTMLVSAAITYVIHLLVEKPFLYLRDVLFQPTIRQPRP